MESIFASKSVGISELKANPAAVLLAAESEPIAVLNRNKTAGYLVSPKAWEAMFEALENAELSAIANLRLNDGKKPVKISIDAL